MIELISNDISINDITSKYQYNPALQSIILKLIQYTQQTKVKQERKLIFGIID
jgi:hypothetical protein